MARNFKKLERAEPKALCACGCKEFTTINQRTGKRNHYIHGHSSRKRTVLDDGSIGKECPRCNKTLPLNSFKARTSIPGSVEGYCISCSQSYRNEYYNRRRQVDPQYRQQEQEKRVKYRKTSNGQSVELEYRKRTRQSTRERSNKWYSLNKERHRITSIRWQKENPERWRELCRRTNRKKLSTPLGRFVNRVRCAVRKGFRRLGENKGGRTFDLLGYSPYELYAHLGPSLGTLCIMCLRCKLNLKNSHIDHITLLSRAKNKVDVIYLNRLDNLRLVCGPCNMRRQK